jgi:hypothetical protein
VKAAGNCTSTGDCCTGLVCSIPPGAPYGTCTAPPPPPDGGTPPPMCALYGQACSATVPCCNNVPCSAPGGSGNPCNGQTGCTCYTIVP